MRLIILALILVLGAPAWGRAYTVDPSHSRVTFSVTHMIGTVQGRFQDFQGEIVYEPDKPQNCSVSMTVQAVSLDTENETRDKRLRAANFLNTDKFTTLSFVSHKVQVLDPGHLSVEGDMTIHGVTRPMTVTVALTTSGDLADFTTDFVVLRKDYGLVWNRTLDSGGTMMGEEVQVHMQVEARAKK